VFYNEHPFYFGVSLRSCSRDNVIHSLAKTTFAALAESNH